MIATIYALSTPPGRSGVAVIRVSGPQAWAGLAALRGKKEAGAAAYDDSSKPDKAATAAIAAIAATGAMPPTTAPPPSAALCKITRLSHPVSHETIDRALVLQFKSPRSFTGEDVVEYQVHGGRAVIDSLLEALSHCPNHRMAEPGEFTRRAFENGKMDLTEAEAIADLIDAETQAQKNQALMQMDGALSNLYRGWTEELKKALAHLEADLEFPDEDLPDGVAPQVIPVLENLIKNIADHLNDNRRGERLRDGIHVAVIGAPNAGKSSLVNALAQRNVAIVSELEGTTRDVIEVHLDLGGLPVILADTAGLRPDEISAASGGQNAIESEGIKRALQRAQEADIKLLLFDGANEKIDKHTVALADENALIVINKADVFNHQAHQAHQEKFKNKLGDLGVLGGKILFISAATGQGLDQLIEVLIERARTLIGSSEAPSLTRQRHRTALEEARDALTRALAAKLPELMAEDTRLAIRALGRITGKVDVEDLLDVIFRDFCIGK